MSDYKMTIGLEVHAELKTKSKMFCGCRNISIEQGREIKPNTNVCPICMGHPGTLPVINREAVRKVLTVGAALLSELADFTEWDRKNYFYPDIPKGYQISQYKYPLVSGGFLNGIALTRVHLEEDTARSTHENSDFSLVDFNRAGLPLMELVTEPSMHSAEEAVKFAKELQLLLQYLEVSGANMEKGEMRVEVNISVSKNDTKGTKVEVKNINSFRAVLRAIEYEFKRQSELLDNGGKVIQETRGFDENKGATFSQRLKESAHDYRYFPDPDLTKFLISEVKEFSLDNLKKSLPELPKEKRERLKKLGLKNEDIETLVSNREAGKFFDETSPSDVLAKLSASYITSDMLGLSKESFNRGKITPEAFSRLMTMTEKGELSSRATKDILKIMFDCGGEPEQVAKDKNLIQKDDPEELKNILQKIIVGNPHVVSQYKNGKEEALQFFVGLAMKETKGSANPEVLQKIAKELLTK